MTDLHRHFPREDLVAVADKLLADRRRGDPEAVRRNVFTAERAAQRERVAAVIAGAMHALLEHRAIGDVEQQFIDSSGAEGASWPEIRADLAAVSDAARRAALQPGAHPDAQQHALKLLALADLFDPAVVGGHYPLITTIPSSSARSGAARPSVRSVPPRSLCRRARAASPPVPEVCSADGQPPRPRALAARTGRGHSAARARPRALCRPGRS